MHLKPLETQELPCGAHCDNENIIPQKQTKNDRAKSAAPQNAKAREMSAVLICRNKQKQTALPQRRYSSANAFWLNLNAPRHVNILFGKAV